MSPSLFSSLRNKLNSGKLATSASTLTPCHCWANCDQTKTVNYFSSKFLLSSTTVPEKSNVSSLFNLKLVNGNQFLHWHSARRPRRHQALIKQLGGSYPIPSHKACSLISILRVMSDSDFWFTHPQDHRACNNLHEMELFPAKMWVWDFLIIAKLLFTIREVLWLPPFSRE